MVNNLKKLTLLAFIPLLLSSCFALHWEFPPFCFQHECVRQQWKGVYFVGNKVKRFVLKHTSQKKKKKKKSTSNKPSNYKTKKTQPEENQIESGESQIHLFRFLKTKESIAPDSALCKEIKDSLLIFYAFNADTLTIANKDSIKAFFEKTVPKNSLCISITGYNDINEPKAINDELSMLRADNVYQYLIEIGIPKSKIIFKEFEKSTNPIREENDKMESTNRKIEIRVY